MSQMSNLDSLLKEAESHLEALRSCMSDLCEIFAGPEKNDAKSESAPKPVPEEKLPTKEEVRAYLANLSRAGHTEEIHAMLIRRGYKKISEVPQTEYPALLEEARSSHEPRTSFSLRKPQVDRMSTQREADGVHGGKGIGLCSRRNTGTQHR